MNDQNFRQGLAVALVIAWGYTKDLSGHPNLATALGWLAAIVGAIAVLETCG